MNNCSDNKSSLEADQEPVSYVSKPRCTDLFRISRAEPWAIKSWSWWPFPLEPKLCFQISKICPQSKSALSPTPIYNIWSPTYFGIKLPQSDTTLPKLNSNDLLVTNYEDDTASLKTTSTEPISFHIDNLISGIDVDYPGILCCRCCFRYRGSVTIGTSERWQFEEIDQSYYQFQRLQGVDDKGFPKMYPESILWERFGGWKTGEYGEAPTDLPFVMNKDTRFCRANLSKHQDWQWDATGLVAPVCAIMNHEGFVFIDGLKGARGIDTADLQELVLMTGLAVAKFERTVWEK